MIFSLFVLVKRSEREVRETAPESIKTKVNSSRRSLSLFSHRRGDLALSFFAVVVRVEGGRELPVRALYFVRGGAASHAQHRVQILLALRRIAFCVLIYLPWVAGGRGAPRPTRTPHGPMEEMRCIPSEGPAARPPPGACAHRRSPQRTRARSRVKSALERARRRMFAEKESCERKRTESPACPHPAAFHGVVRRRLLLL